MLKIIRIKLAEQRIDEASSFFASTGDKNYIIRNDNNRWQQAYMPGEPVIALTIQRKFLFTSFAQDAHHFNQLVVLVKFTFNPETTLLMLYVLHIRSVEIRFRKTEIINGVDQVRFANAVFATNPDDPLVEPKRGVGIVLKLENRY